MSINPVFCLDCWQIDYGVPPKNGVASGSQMMTNHWDHSLHVFGPPDDYPPPMAVVLKKLGSGIPVNVIDMWLFDLSIALDGIQPNNGVTPRPIDDNDPSGRKIVLAELGIKAEGTA